MHLALGDAAPTLSPPEQRKPDIPAELQRAATVFKRDGAGIELAVAWIEHSAAGPSIAVLLEVPENPKPDDRLIF
jgi:hypothetical protein